MSTMSAPRALGATELGAVSGGITEQTVHNIDTAVKAAEIVVACAVCAPATAVGAAAMAVYLFATM
jgi:hypothetical protein